MAIVESAETDSVSVERRNFVTTVGTVGMAGWAGCMDILGDSTDSANGGPTEIDFWGYFGSNEGEEIRSLVDKFNNKNNDVRVNHQSVPFDQYINKLFTAVKAETAPHVAAWYLSYARYFKQICKPIDKYLSSDTGNKYFEVAWEHTQLNGNTYALPIDIHMKCLCVNDDLMSDAGVEPPFINWGDFKNACNTIKQKTNARPFALSIFSQGMFRPFDIALRQNGGEILRGPVGDRTVVVDSPIGKSITKLVADITGTFDWDVPVVADTDKRYNDFLNGNLAMTLAGNWDVNAFETSSGEMPDDFNFTYYKPFIFLGYENTSQKNNFKETWCESNSLYFPRNPNHSEEENAAAVKFGEFITQNNLLWAFTAGHLPSTKAIATSDRVQNSALWKKYNVISTLYELAKNKNIGYQPQTEIHFNSTRFWQPLVDVYGHEQKPVSAIDTSAQRLRKAFELS